MKDKIYIEPPESERKYRRLEKLGKELGVPVPQVFLEYQVTMPDGSFVPQRVPDGRIAGIIRQRSHSWTRNAYNLVFSELAGVDINDNTYAAGKLSIKDTAAVVKFSAIPAGLTAVQASASCLTAGQGYTCAAGTVTTGILVGSNVGAESFEDYVLLTPIANGNGAGQLAYALSDAYTISYVAGTKTLSVAHIRYMNNNSPGDVTVREITLVGAIRAQGANINGLTSRDHVADIVIPATGQLKATYTISLVYPA